MTELDDDQLAARIKAVLTHAVANLAPDDRDARIAWCREHDQHGTRMRLDDDDDVLVFVWGGKTLAMIRRRDLLNDGPLYYGGVETDFPDTVPADWTDQ